MAMTPPTAAVLRAAADGDVDARARVIDAILPSVMGWCSRLGGQKVDAEDAAHDVCIVTLERLPTLRSPEAFSGWVFGITRRVLAKHRRRATWWSWMPLSDELPARNRCVARGMGASASEPSVSCRCVQQVSRAWPGCKHTRAVGELPVSCSCTAAELQASCRRAAGEPQVRCRRAAGVLRASVG